MMKYAAEFLGTFFFLSVILHATSKSAVWPAMTPLLIAVGLLAAITTAAGTSGAHLNPAVSVMMAMKGALPQGDVLGYVGAQILGGVTALWVYRMVQGKSVAK
jgi:glycerol uptake facilitator-like aquaporin